MKPEETESSAAAAGGDESRAIPATSEAVEEEDDYEFEFSLVVDAAVPSTADDLFQDGHIRTAYPLFDSGLLLGSEPSNKAEDGAVEKLPFRKLTIQEPEVLPRSESASSSSSIDSERMAKVLVQAPPFKSSSTGSSSRRWRLRDLMGVRSNSDGKEKFMFLAPTDKNKSTAKPTTDSHKKKGKGKGQKTTEVNMATLHRMFYDKPAGGGGGGGAGGGSRRSSEPYKQGFVGFLGLGRTF